MFDAVSHHVVCGYGFFIEEDHLQRYKYPIALHNVLNDTSGMRVLSPDIGVLMLKAPRAEREPAPAHVHQLQRMWAVIQSAADQISLQQTCHFCGGAESGTDLRTCALCMLTSHNACAEQRSTSTQFSFSKDTLLPEDLFGDHNVCAICLACFI